MYKRQSLDGASRLEGLESRNSTIGVDWDSTVEAPFDGECDRAVFFPASSVISTGEDSGSGVEVLIPRDSDHSRSGTEAGMSGSGGGLSILGSLQAASSSATKSGMLRDEM